MSTEHKVKIKLDEESQRQLLSSLKLNADEVKQVFENLSDRIQYITGETDRAFIDSLVRSTQLGETQRLQSLTKQLDWWRQHGREVIAVLDITEKEGKVVYDRVTRELLSQIEKISSTFKVQLPEAFDKVGLSANSLISVFKKIAPAMALSEIVVGLMDAAQHIANMTRATSDLVLGLGVANNYIAGLSSNYIVLARNIELATGGLVTQEQTLRDMQQLLMRGGAEVMPLFTEAGMIRIAALRELPGIGEQAPAMIAELIRRFGIEAENATQTLAVLYSVARDLGIPFAEYYKNLQTMTQFQLKYNMTIWESAQVLADWQEDLEKGRVTIQNVTDVMSGLARVQPGQQAGLLTLAFGPEMGQRAQEILGRDLYTAFITRPQAVWGALGIGIMQRDPAILELLEKTAGVKLSSEEMVRRMNELFRETVKFYTQQIAVTTVGVQHSRDALTLQSAENMIMQQLIPVFGISPAMTYEMSRKMLDSMGQMTNRQVEISDTIKSVGEDLLKSAAYNIAEARTLLGDMKVFTKDLYQGIVQAVREGIRDGLKGTRQFGGLITEEGAYYMHKGEVVIPSNLAVPFLVSSRQGDFVYNFSVGSINIAVTEDELESQIDNALDKFRKDVKSNVIDNLLKQRIKAEVSKV